MFSFCLIYDPFALICYVGLAENRQYYIDGAHRLGPLILPGSVYPNGIHVHKHQYMLSFAFALSNNSLLLMFSNLLHLYLFFFWWSDASEDSNLSYMHITGIKDSNVTNMSIPYKYKHCRSWLLKTYNWWIYLREIRKF